jgi:hypothetical protein
MRCRNICNFGALGPMTSVSWNFLGKMLGGRVPWVAAALLWYNVTVSVVCVIECGIDPTTMPPGYPMKPWEV